MPDLPIPIRRRALAARCEVLRPLLQRVARAWGCERELARELVQETIVRALQNLAQLREEKSLQSWLISILLNNYRAHWRRARKLTGFEAAELEDTREPLSEFEREHTIERVRRAIDCLSDDHRQVITLVDMEGMSYAEVARALDIRIGTVMSRVSRARARLRELLLDVVSEDSAPAGKPGRHLWEVK